MQIRSIIGMGRGVPPSGGGGGGWAHVQTNGNGNGASSATIAQAYGSNVTAGSLLVCIATANTAGATITGVADSLGQTWTRIGTEVIGQDAMAAWSASIFYQANSSAGANTVTATFSSSIGARQLIIGEYTGIVTSSPLDKNFGNAQTNAGTGTDAITSTAVTTTQTNELIWGAFVSRSGTFNSNAGTGFTSRLGVNDGTFAICRAEDQNLAAAGSVAATFTSPDDASVDPITFVATFKTP